MRFEIEDQQSAPFAFSRAVDRELEGEPPATGVDGGIRCVVATSIAVEESEPLPGGASVEGEPPDVEWPGNRDPLEIALDESPCPVGRHALHLLVQGAVRV